MHRPWGWYDGVDAGERFQVKRIPGHPGAALSLQMHHHRAEHWIVVRGTARVTRGDETLLVSENQSTFIPPRAPGTGWKPGKVPLEMIEVQSGSYLGEDDIVRFEDTTAAAELGETMILVTGGTGYIGSYTVVELLATGHEPVIPDNLSNSSATVVDRIERIAGRRPPLVVGDIRDGQLRPAVQGLPHR